MRLFEKKKKKYQNCLTCDKVCASLGDVHGIDGASQQVELSDGRTIICIPVDNLQWEETAHRTTQIDLQMFRTLSTLMTQLFILMWDSVCVLYTDTENLTLPNYLLLGVHSGGDILQPEYPGSVCGSGCAHITYPVPPWWNLVTQISWADKMTAI